AVAAAAVFSGGDLDSATSATKPLPHCFCSCCSVSS
ncbi:hypothetical protein A2U01_0038383, partial [Trifolium medium]|nr:hypothetical protein [Trifolium medium]